MKKFVIEESFWDVFPEAKIGIVVCKDIDNRVKGEEIYLQLLEKAQKKALDHLPEEEFSSNQVIQVWREAFQKFKTKKGARSSIEALLKRAHNGKGIGPINPLVDIYNSISLTYALPCGGEDIDKFSGDIRLTKATGTEDFVTLGSDKSEPPYEGEIIYKDQEGAVCRCWNWREAVRTMLTEETRNTFLCIESVDPQRHEDLEVALKELSELVQDNLGGQCKISIIDRSDSEVEIQK